MLYSCSGDPGAKDVTEGTASGVSDVRSGSLCASYFNGVAKVARACCSCIQELP
jgi:hypothetical protein